MNRLLIKLPRIDLDGQSVLAHATVSIVESDDVYRVSCSLTLGQWTLPSFTTTERPTTKETLYRIADRFLCEQVFAVVCEDLTRAYHVPALQLLQKTSTYLRTAIQNCKEILP